MDVLLSYSNRSDRLDVLADVMARIAALGDDEPTADPAPAPVVRPPAQTHDLGDDQVRDIFACYRRGTGPRELARRHGVTERAVKYLLKKHGVQRVRAGGVLLGGQA